MKIANLSKKLSLTLVFGGLGLLSFGQVKYTLEGTVKNIPKGGNTYIYRMGSGPLDSALIQNGSFRFSGEGNPGTQLYLSRQSGGAMDAKAGTSIYIDKGKLKVNLDYNDFSTTQVEGSKAQDDYYRWENRIAAPRASISPINAAYNEGNMEYIALNRQLKALEQEVATKKEDLEQLRAAMGPFQKQISGEVPVFIRENPASYVSANLLFMYMTSMSLEEANGLYEGLSPQVRESQFGKMAGEKIAAIKGGSVGSVASVFSTTDIDGNALSLSDFKGQYVLLDFWASWCVPCRKGNPHLIELHNKYHDKGFEIIGISDDDSNHAAWHKAVADDQIQIWKHVLRGLQRTAGGGFDKSKDISEPYGISTLPTKILIDPNGMIVGRYGSNGGTDADLDKKLIEIFGAE